MTRFLTCISRWVITFLHYKSTGSSRRKRRHLRRKKSRNPFYKVLVKNKVSVRESQGFSMLILYRKNYIFAILFEKKGQGKLFLDILVVTANKFVKCSLKFFFIFNHNKLCIVAFAFNFHDNNFV